MSVKMKKIIIILIIVIMATTYFLIPLFNKEYIHTLSTVDEYTSVVNGFIYFGSPDYTSCESFMPILEKFAKKNMIEVYYFNLKYLMENELITEDEFNEILEKHEINEMPTVIEVIDGQCTASVTAHMYNTLEEDYVTKQLNKFFDESPIRIKGVPPFDIHNIINMIIYLAFIIIIIVSMFVSKKYNKIMYLLILMLFILNCINFWNYGIYVDENNTSITYHLGTLGWINMLLGFLALLKNMFIRK